MVKFPQVMILYVKANGIRIYYASAGAGRPLLLLHGNGEDHSVFSEASAVLSRRFAVYMPDTRSHGKSQAAPLSYTAMAADAAGFIEALGLEKPLVFGFSDGGITALLLALEHPGIAGALVIAGANLFPSGIKALPLALFALQWFFSRSPLTALMLREPHIAPEELSRIDVPVTVLAGQRDLIRGSHTKLIAESIPGSRLEILKGRAHGNYVVHSEIFTRYI